MLRLIRRIHGNKQKQKHIPTRFNKIGSEAQVVYKTKRLSDESNTNAHQEYKLREDFCWKLAFLTNGMSHRTGLTFARLLMLHEFNL